MIELKFKPITGKLNLDDLPLEIDTEEGFCKCDLYRELVKHKAVKKIMPNMKKSFDFGIYIEWNV
ncbi:hypothetical protein N5C39_08350 [Enterobacter bugandensis]|uniref:Uncharacterized protein n=1 Tax=Enterobacter bugandensis TaxID=881260 RepID=A0AA42PR63_9ENTR|nr:hypothetical protein [Enterobacter bugandensis]MDH1318373.1 hypothetical protein [Enterobacter bugandensis]